MSEGQCNVSTLPAHICCAEIEMITDVSQWTPNLMSPVWPAILNLQEVELREDKISGAERSWNFQYAFQGMIFIGIQGARIQRVRLFGGRYNYPGKTYHRRKMARAKAVVMTTYVHEVNIFLTFEVSLSSSTACDFSRFQQHIHQPSKTWQSQENVYQTVPNGTGRRHRKTENQHWESASDIRRFNDQDKNRHNLRGLLNDWKSTPFHGGSGRSTSSEWGRHFHTSTSTRTETIAGCKPELNQLH